MADLPSDIAGLIAEVTGDSLSSLEQERSLEPKLAPLRDSSELGVRGYELARDN